MHLNEVCLKPNVSQSPTVCVMLVCFDRSTVPGVKQLDFGQDVWV